MAVPETTSADPSVVVSHLDVVYRVFGAKRRGSASSSSDSPFGKLVPRGRNPVGGMREVHAVRDVSFVAYHGESIGIIGKNGSGKSTLLRAVAGLIPPTRGEVFLSGQPSLLGINAVLMSKLSGERNVMIGAQALGLTAEQARARMDDIVEFSGIGDFIHLPMSTYSSGMAARLRFAISTAAVPDILMVDEALATGDADFKERSQDKIQQIREEAGTVFLVSHSAPTIAQMCDRALWMDRGQLIMEGSAKEVAAAYRKKYPPRKKAAAKQGASKKRGGQQGSAGRDAATKDVAEQPRP